MNSSVQILYTIPNLDEECKNAGQHDNKLEHIRPDHGFYPTLKHNYDNWRLKTHPDFYRNFSNVDSLRVFV